MNWKSMVELKLARTKQKHHQQQSHPFSCDTNTRLVVSDMSCGRPVDGNQKTITVFAEIVQFLHISEGKINKTHQKDFCKPKKHRTTLTLNVMSSSFSIVKSIFFLTQLVSDAAVGSQITSGISLHSRHEALKVFGINGTELWRLQQSVEAPDVLTRQHCTIFVRLWLNLKPVVKLFCILAIWGLPARPPPFAFLCSLQL